ncbi:hypothetical protein AKJ51_03255 [candidate division MSBL1 archaeon SCGC-AAA382A20]|uniref:Large ribosomal subunit protein eL18 n=1 Tax=candidate division MSBL1 archaeon SCGC-AAA382A20 TaxID=1698280 RepID=A0A133VJM6_9EURY|nr:hypothetical protein AKJ51_03255 [candidate division MSBL1 archaeon SCGC-AAA382A20]
MDKTNPVLKETVRKLRKKSKEEGADIWKDLSQRLMTAERKKNPVNLAKINRHCEDGDTVVVPGKVTGYGNLEKNVTVAAFSFSKNARDEINEVGNAITIEELLQEKPEGSEVKVMEG